MSDGVIVRKPGAEELERLGTASWPVWTCPASSFDWSYDETETCLILEGRVTVSWDGGSAGFAKGDLVVFPKGLSCTWTVHEAVRKHYRFG